MSTALTGKVVFPVRQVCPFRIFSALCAAFLLSSCMGGGENEKAFQREMDLLAKDVSSGNMAALRSRLTPAHASAKTANGVPLVLLAAANGRRDVLELLLAKGADPAAKDARGTCAL
ncbi:MAG: ankyrin repeat domain-containing protein, partial [Lentisphaeria bacterium]|nr:ankyrin repeat domain-containing protein [Lentisphaeria bacterium]